MRHALIGEDHRDRLCAVAFVAQHVEPFGAALGANHPEFPAILGNEVSSDRAQYLRIVIDGEDKRFDHEAVVDDSSPWRTSPALTGSQRRLDERRYRLDGLTEPRRSHRFPYSVNT
jgi:hypothetical protein